MYYRGLAKNTPITPLHPPAFSSQTPPKRVLVVCTQRIGDVLLATPLARSVKAAWPDAQLDFLVLPGTQGVLEGNPDVHQVLAFPQRASLREKLAQLGRIWRRYDLSFAAIPSDRARIFAWAAARFSVGFTTAEEASWLKRHLLNIAVPFDNLQTHTVTMGLRLVEALGLPAIGQVQAPRVLAENWCQRLEQLGLTGVTNYAVIHPNPKFRYKMWDSSKWIALISWLRQQGIEVLLTGSGDPSEAAYVRDIAGKVPEGCRCLTGLLSLAETAELLKGARLFVGPDTAVTHLAAATGIPTIALFGPSNPVKWGPWPKDCPAGDSPWSFIGSGHQGNVRLIQGPGDCVPCLFEGCDRHLDSDSQCLLAITVEQVVEAARAALVS
ncbi:MAG: glycosyltransferase family 9 protein [Proteobacteria bacterium]|nr:glycosyltransferase family 9 protein [Pseudomonadota bacterium]